jgi:hypothetical protein
MHKCIDFDLSKASANSARLSCGGHGHGCVNFWANFVFNILFLAERCRHLQSRADTNFKGKRKHIEQTYLRFG